MFWNNVKWKSVRSWSITVRLTWLFAFCIFLILMLTKSAVYVVLIDILQKAGNQFLTDEVTTILNILQHEPYNHQALRQEVLWNPTPQKSRQDRAFFYYIR